MSKQYFYEYFNIKDEDDINTTILCVSGSDFFKDLSSTYGQVFANLKEWTINRNGNEVWLSLVPDECWDIQALPDSDPKFVEYFLHVCSKPWMKPNAIYEYYHVCTALSVVIEEGKLLEYVK